MVKIDSGSRIDDFLRTDVEKKNDPNSDELINLLNQCFEQIIKDLDYKALLIFLFFKAISDKYNAKVEEYKKAGYSEEDAFILVNKEFVMLYDEKNKEILTWDKVTKNTDPVKGVVDALVKISKLNSELKYIEKILEVTGLLGSITGNNVQILRKIENLCNRYDFSEVNYDIIGDAYQWILLHSAYKKINKEEIYTPKEIIRLLVNLLDISNGSSVLDPACGSAAMLIESYNFVKGKGEEPNLDLKGQDIKENSVAIAKMNLVLHDITGTIYLGDSLTNPQFYYADYVIANPRWNQDGYDENKLSDQNVWRIYNSVISGGYTNRHSADWAWVQLMNYYAKNKVGVVLDQGALFRGGRELNIRKAFLEKDLIEGVILLPEKLFYNENGTGIILIINKNKSEERKGKVIFINASKLYEKHPEERRLNILSEEHIRKITQAYRDFKDAPELAKVVSIEEIKKNGWNLNVSLYVNPEEKEEEIDIVKEFEELKELEKQRQETLAKIEDYVSKLRDLNG